jgi:hypothetical protein
MPDPSETVDQLPPSGSISTLNEYDVGEVLLMIIRSVTGLPSTVSFFVQIQVLSPAVPFHISVFPEPLKLVCVKTFSFGSYPMTVNSTHLLRMSNKKESAWHPL